jgi:tellurite resistance protein
MMKRSEKEASLRVLLAVARADGVVDPEERRTLGVVAAQVGIPDPSDGPIDLEAELARLVSPEARERVVSAAHAMANVDGRCSPQEHAVLQRIHAVLGGDGTPDLPVAQREWASRMGTARQGIDRATAEFLRAVASLGDASNVAYRQLVEELDEKKRGALRKAMELRNA